MKKKIISSIITGILMVSAVTCLVPEMTVTASAATNKVGTVNASNVNLRAGAGIGYKSLAKLQKGTKVNILNKANGWYEVTYKNIHGYISTEYVDAPGFDFFDDVILKYNATGKVKVSNTLNVRTAPDRNSASKGSLKNGTVVTIVGRSFDKKWYKIKYKTGYGFVSADYIVNVKER